MRSLAVNHPLTLLRATCLALQVPGQHPPIADDDLFSGKDVRSAIAINVMSGACEALQDRTDLHSGPKSDAGEEDDDVKKRCAPLCSAAMKHVIKSFLSGSKSSIGEDAQVVSVKFLESLCSFSAKATPKPILKICIPAVLACVEEGLSGPTKSKSPVLVACCACLQTAIEQLGRGVMERLNDIAPPLLQMASSRESKGKKGPAADDAKDLVKARALQVLQALVKNVGAFLSPFLKDILQLLTTQLLPWETPMLEDLGRDLVACVPARLLLPAVQSAVVAAEQDLSSAAGGESELAACLVRMQRLASLKAWIFAQATPDFVSSGLEVSANALLRLLSAGPKAAVQFLQSGGEVDDLTSKLLKPEQSGKIVGSIAAVNWPERCSVGTVFQMHALSAEAFTQFALRLDLEQIRPCMRQLLDWARDGQAVALAKQGSKKGASEDGSATDTDVACRFLAVLSVMRALASAAPGISEELLLPLSIKDLSSSLTAARRYAMKLAVHHRSAGRKRRKGLAAGGEPVSLAGSRAGQEVLQEHQWWWLEVSLATLSFLAAALRPLGGTSGSSESRIVDETFEALLEPCIDLIDIFEFLPPSDQHPASRLLGEVLQSAIVSLAAPVDGPKIKQLFTNVLGKTRADDVEVRLCAVRCCHRVWSELGVQVVSGLSEVVMFASELLEDEDSRVEDAVRALIKTLEDCTGESLQEALKP